MLVRCESCPMVYIANPPQYELLTDSQAFAWEPSMAREHESRRQKEPILHAVQDMLRPIRKLLKPDKLRKLALDDHFRGRVLDLGCGTGHRSLRKFPAEAVLFGIEIEPGPAQKADAAFRERGGQVWCASSIDGLTALESQSIDAALLYSYLEHESQPYEVLVALNRVLRPGAPVIMKMPNYGSLTRRVRGRRWCGYRFPDHVNYFTPTTLRMLLERAGYIVRRSRWIDHFPFNDNMWCITARPQ